jgi:predicted TIM-barrel fold metal-dependent hydrolase
MTDILERTAFVDVPHLSESSAQADAARRVVANTGAVDCDVHASPRSPDDLKKFLSKRWVDYLDTYGLRTRSGVVNALPYPKAAPGAVRRDAMPPSGGLAGSDRDFMIEDYLDPLGVRYAILTPLLFSGQTDVNTDFSVAMATAKNNWQIDAWTSHDKRFKGSLILPFEDPIAAVKEIERWAGHPDFVQVLLLTRTPEPLGNRRYWPMLEAAAAHNLPVAVHVFGEGGHAFTSAGWPTYYLEEMTGHSQTCQAMIASLVFEGAFERFPDLKVVCIEGGFGWLSSLKWRLDKHAKTMANELPHLTKLPSEYIRDQVYITTQPMEEPARAEHLMDTIDWIGDDRILFASDYPHWDFDNPAIALPPRLGPERKQKILSGNAMKLYGLS